VRGEDTFSGASHHMIEAWELFNSLTEDLGTHVELGDDTKYAVKGRELSCFNLI
jgi:hypothetical protein